MSDPSTPSNPSTPAGTGTRSTLSTHVLDAERGEPAGGMSATLNALQGDTLATGTTDADGRISFDVALAPGIYALTFSTGAWFVAAGRTTFYPAVHVTFETEPGRTHHHVPVLLSPYSFTTYRGS